VLLSGDPAEGPLLGGTKAQPQPAGRGLLVRRGERPVLVQTAFSPPTPVPGSAVSSSWTSGES
jgi:S-DNA-T family DNA segregation ATPase FtsK/SpoIIIE